MNNDNVRKMLMKAKYQANLNNEEFGVDYQEEAEMLMVEAVVNKCIELGNMEDIKKYFKSA
jgi:hypothetical protein